MPISFRPTPVGESRHYLPTVGDISGDAAWDSLLGYYPTRRMDSVLNPHTYKPPTRSKLADVYAAARQGTVRRLVDQPQSEFVNGFMRKCAEAQLTTDQTFQAIQRAIAIHPLIAGEFAKCGIVKHAMGSGMPAPSPGLPTSNPLKPMGGAATPHPAVPSPPPPPQRNVIGQGLHNVGNLTVGTGTALAGGLGTLGGAVGSGVARMTDGVGLTQNWTPAADAFTNTMGKAVHSGVATGWAGLTNQEPHDVAQQMGGGVYGDVAPVSDMTRSHIQQLQQHGVELPTPMGEHGYKINGPQAAGAYNLLTETGHDAARMVPAAIAGGPAPQMLSKYLPAAAAPAAAALQRAPWLQQAPKAVMGYQATTGQPGQALMSSVNSLLEAPTVAGAPQHAAEHMPKFMSGSTYGQDAAQPGETPTEPPIIPPSPAPAAEQPAEPPAAQPSAAPESVVTQTPMYKQIAGFVQQFPEKAQAFAQQATGQLSEFFKSPAAKPEINSVMQTGDVSPMGQKAGLTALTGEGFNFEQAGQIFNGMNGWEKLGLIGGIGMSALGLLHALFSENGGIGSVMMSLLGLGAAGFTAGKAGLLDQGSKDLAGGISDAVGGLMGQQQPQVPAGLKQALPALMEHGNDAAISGLLKTVPHLYPDAVPQLNRAAGTGSWGNAAMSWLGDMTGQRQRLMQDQLGLNPEQQDRLLRLWSQQQGTQ